jgi:hypothetical protein
MHSFDCHGFSSDHGVCEFFPPSADMTGASATATAFTLEMLERTFDGKKNQDEHKRQDNDIDHRLLLSLMIRFSRILGFLDPKIHLIDRRTDQINRDQRHGGVEHRTRGISHVHSPNDDFVEIGSDMPQSSGCCAGCGQEAGSGFPMP